MAENKRRRSRKNTSPKTNKTPVTTSEDKTEPVITSSSTTESQKSLSTEAGPINIIKDADPATKATPSAKDAPTVAFDEVLKGETVIKSTEEIMVPLALQTARYKSIPVGIFSCFTIGSLIWFLGFSIFLFAFIPNGGVDTQSITAVGVMSGILFGGLTLIGTILIIYRNLEHNRQLNLRFAKIEQQLNSRYNIELTSQEVYDLVNDFRIPVNYQNSRIEIKLTTLRRGRDARLTVLGTNRELPATGETVL